jgi:HlyD family secretion protein
MAQRPAKLSLLVLLITFTGMDYPAAGTEKGTVRVRKGTLVKHLTFTGEVRAKNSVTILTPDIRGLRGYTISYLVPDGSFVRPGDLLAQFDASELEVRRLDTEKDREEARIAIAQKEAEIDSRRQDILINLALADKNMKVALLNASIDSSLLARADFERYQLEYSKAKLEFDKATERLANLETGSKAELDIVRLGFEQADLDLQRLQVNLEKMTIRAPAPGLALCNEYWQSGRKFQQGDTVFGGFPIISLPDLGEIQVLANVHTQDFALLRDATTAEVVLDSLPGRVFRAEIATLPQAATPYRYRSELKVFRVVFDVRSSDTSVFKPGMTARVRVPVKVGEGLVIPRGAISTGSQGKTFVQPQGAKNQTPVTVIKAADDEVLIEGDLQEGQELSLNGASEGSKPRSQSDWITVKKEDLTFGVSGSGQLQASQAVEIRPPNLRGFHRFKIVSMIDEGSEVEAGDMVVEFDKTDIMRRMQDETATLARVNEERERTQASLEVQRRDLELQLEEARVQEEKAANKLREAREFESDLKVKTAEYEAAYAKDRVGMLEKKLGSVNLHAELQIKVLDDRISFYQSRLRIAREAMEALSVKAPAPGVVIYAANWNNEKKQVGSDVHSMETILSLPRLDTLMVEGQVAEVDAGKVSQGQRVSVTLDAIPDRTFQGEITRVSEIFTEASADRPIKVLRISVRLHNLDVKRMRPGMVARLEVIVDRFEDVVAVPLAVIEVEDGKSYVWVKRGDKTERRPVELGKDNGIVAVVSSGLTEGEQVAGRPVETKPVS